MRISIKIIVASLILFSSLPLSGQVTTGIVKGMLVELETKDGMNLFGNVEKISADTLMLVYETYGQFTIGTNRIKSIKHIQKNAIRTDGFWHENSNYSRNFYGPTALGLKKGKGYYQNIMLVWNHFAYAFTDYFTLGVDFEIVSILALLSGEELFEYPIPIIGLTPKLAFPINDRLHIGGGAWMIFVPEGDNFLDLGITYAVGTYGSKDKNFTVGLGFTWFDNSMHFDAPIVTLAGQTRASKSISLVSENWFFLTDNNIFESSAYLGIHGIRYLAKKLTWDFGLILVAGGDEINFLPLPYIGIAFKFEQLLKRNRN